jgi:hypothetical protein
MTLSGLLSERWEFNDPDNFEYELHMDYDNRVNLESIEWQGRYGSVS